jgi:hypothetical protein
MSTFSDITPENTIVGGTDNTTIGNIADALKVHDVSNTVDPLTDRLVTEDAIHFEAHEGDLYSHSHVHTLQNGGTLYHLIITPASPITTHYRYIVNASAAGRVALYEGPTTSANGNAANVYTHNRNLIATKVANCLIYHGPTVSAEGTLLSDEAFGANGGSKQGSNNTGDAFEWVLNANSKYLLKYTSSAVGNDFSEYQHFYEEGA